MKTISITEAKRRFSELISRAAAGERFLIQRRKRSMAVLISPAELERLERTSQAARQLAEALGQSADLLAEIGAGEVHPEVLNSFSLPYPVALGDLLLTEVDVAGGYRVTD